MSRRIIQKSSLIEGKLTKMHFSLFSRHLARVTLPFPTSRGVIFDVTLPLLLFPSPREQTRSTGSRGVVDGSIANEDGPFWILLKNLKARDLHPAWLKPSGDTLAGDKNRLEKSRSDVSR